MKKDVKVIKGDTTLKRTASGCVERSIKRVAAYCRVSTDNEDQINSYNSQVEHYTEYIKKNNEWTLAGIYADEAITGTQVDRRIDFQRLINDCMNGDIDMIITKSISRFARNTLDTLKYVRKLKEFNVAVFFEEENINTLTMDGELLLTILSSVAQQEVENISANVKKGLRMKMERGEMVGFQGCLGYDYDPETKSISVNEKEAEIVRYIFRRYLEGVGGMVISRELEEQGYLSPRGYKKWTETTVLGIIKNEKYKGDLLMGKTYTVDPISKRRLDNFGEQDKFYIQNHHEPIISEEDFEKAQGIRIRRSKNRNTIENKGGKREKYSRKYAFSSMLECGFCGHTLSRRTWHSSTDHSKIIWQCVNATKNGKKYCPHSKGLEEEAIEKAFMESYRQVCHNNVEITNEFLKTVEEELKDNSLSKELKKVSNQLDKVLKKEKDLVELRLNEAISMDLYQEKYNEITLSKEKLLGEKRTLEVTLTDEKALKKRLEGFKRLLESNKYLEEFDRAVFESIVDKIIIGGTNNDGETDPAMITIIYKTGKKDSQDGRLFKNKRKNAKEVEGEKDNKLYPQSSNEVDKLYSYSKDNTYSTDAFDENLPMHYGSLHEPLPEITTKNSSKNTSYISSENSSHLPIHEDKGLYTMGGLEGGNKKIKSYQSCLEELRESTGYNEHMELGNKNIARTYDEIIRVLADVMILNADDTVTINQTKLPAYIVQERFRSLDSSHMEYLVNALPDNEAKIRNVRAFILTAAYNAPSNMDAYYTALVSYDMREGGL